MSICATAKLPSRDSIARHVDNKSDGSVTEQTLLWVAWLFRVPIESLEYSKRFGSDIRPSSASCYGLETFDVLAEDITDLEKVLKLPAEREYTVGGLCKLVERLNEIDPMACQRLLASWQQITSHETKPKWRQIFRLIGV